MKNNKKITIMILVVILLVIVFVVGYMFLKQQKKNSNYVEIDTESTNLEIEYSEEELNGEWTDYTAKITLDDTKTTIEGKGVANSANTIIIQSAGTYYISGSISDGNILIQAGKNDDVQLVLDNVSITSTTTAPINGVTADKLTITLAEGSTNTVTDSNSYTNFTDQESLEPDGAIFTKTDLVINGTGKLVVNANYTDGIVSKDGLKIVNSNIEIYSEDDGIRGKDYVAINNAAIKITSKGDGIKSTNTTDSTLGYIVVEGGSITVDSERDGIQAETILKISEDAAININTTGEVESSSSQDFGFRGGYKTESTITSEDSISSKGLKAGTELTIDSGTIQIVSTDDSLHSNGIIIINNGSIEASSGDDGIHADTNIVINDGNINITKSYEGIESTYIEINGGTIKVVASDDGINICGGNDSSSIDGRMGQNSFSSIESSNRKLVINNGNITVNASGDGLDANGSIYINGGTIAVAGPTSGGDSALDYDSECIIAGGELILYGSNGMWQNPSNTSTQYCLAFQTSGNSGDEIVLKNSAGTTITSFKTEKNYSIIAISNENIKKAETYSLYVNGVSVENLEANNIVTSNFSSGMNNGNDMKHGGGMKKGF